MDHGKTENVLNRNACLGIVWNMNWTISGNTPWIISDYDLQLGMLIASFAVVVVALFGDKFRKWLEKPIIRLWFNEKSDRCFRKATVCDDRIHGENSAYTHERGYYRLKVENKGGLAKNVKIKIDVFDSDEKEIPYFEPSTLRWISGNEKEDLAKKEVENYVNVCSVVVNPDRTIKHERRVIPAYSTKDEVHISKPLRIELYDTTSERGIIWDLPLDDYIFKITVYGDDFKPISKKFEFKKPSSNSVVAREALHEK